MRIAIDINQTLQSHHLQITLGAKQKFNLNIDLKDFDKWNANIAGQHNFDKRIMDNFMWNDPLLQLRADPYPNAVKTMQKLASKYEIAIITSSCMNDIQITSWLNYHRIPYHQIIRAGSKDKYLFDFDVILDDSPVVIESMQAHTRDFVICEIDSFYSQHLDGPRFDNWDQVEYLLGRM